MTEGTDQETPDLPEYHCVAAAAEVSSPQYGEVTQVVFDMEVLERWVYRELLDVITSDGYELVGFGSIEAVEEAEMFELGEEALGWPVGIFVFRGETED